jgi:N-acylneuraminate cytidylyltransferase
LFEENAEGYLKLSKKDTKIIRRQDAPPVYQYNGSLYIINTKSLRLYESLSEFPRIVKYVMPEEYGTDIDNAADWAKAEYLINNHLVSIDGKC